MKMKSTAFLAIAGATALLATGCMSNGSGMVSPCTKPITQGQYTVVGPRVDGYEDQWFFPFGFSMAQPGSQALRAMDQALKKAPGADALIETSMSVEMLNCGIAQRFRTRITGTPVKTK